MSVLVNKNTRVIIQGITGRGGAFHTKQCLDYGTTDGRRHLPRQGRHQGPNGLPVFDTVAEAVKATGANASMIFVPPPSAPTPSWKPPTPASAVIVAITEGVPVNDMVKVKQFLKGYPNVTLIGPNCPGIITPGECKIGIMPGYIHTRARAPSASSPAPARSPTKPSARPPPAAGPVHLHRHRRRPRQRASTSSTSSNSSTTTPTPTPSS